MSGSHTHITMELGIVAAQIAAHLFLAVLAEGT